MTAREAQLFSALEAAAWAHHRLQRRLKQEQQNHAAAYRDRQVFSVRMHLAEARLKATRAQLLALAPPATYCSEG